MRQKQLMVGVLLAVFMFATAWAAETGKTTADDATIRSIVPNFEKAWTRCDAKALSLLWTKDGDFQSPHASFARGRREIEKFYREAFDSGYCGSAGTGKIESIRLVQKNVADCGATRNDSRSTQVEHAQASPLERSA